MKTKVIAREIEMNSLCDICNQRCISVNPIALCAVFDGQVLFHGLKLNKPVLVIEDKEAKHGK